MFRALLCSSSGGQNCIIQHLVSSHSVGDRPVHGTITYRVWRYQMLYNTILTSWWWTQQCSKHVEGYNKLIIKHEFVHEVGQLLRLYWDSQSAKHKKEIKSLSAVKNKSNSVIIRESYSVWQCHINILQRSQFTTLHFVGKTLAILRLFMLFFFMAQQLLVGHDVLITEASRSHSFRHTTLCTILLDQWSTRSGDPYLTTHLTEISITSVGFEPAITASRRPAT